MAESGASSGRPAKPRTSTTRRLRDAGRGVGPRTFHGYAALPTAVAGPMVLGSLVIAWAVAYLAGGSHTVFPHLFYLAIMMAAVRFGPAGAGVLGDPHRDVRPGRPAPRLARSAVDRFVLQEATRQLATWSREGYDDLTIAVNLSPRRFADHDLVPDTAAALEASGLDPSRLHLEVTETAIIEDVTEAARKIGDLRRLGVRIAIDDFGAGSSSLSYLHRFQVDVIKIDRGFVANVVEDARVGRLVAGMVRLFESIGVTVVGEGIADAEQYVHMTSLRCQVGQGHYIAMPGPADEIGQWLQRSRERAGRRAGGHPSKSAKSSGE